MAVEEQIIKALIIQYNESMRLRSELLYWGFTEALLSDIPVNMKNRQALLALLNGRVDECKQLKKYLETAREEVSKLYAEYKENTHINEFLNFAFSLSKSRDSVEDVNGKTNSEAKILSQYHEISSKNEFVGELNKNNTDNNHKSEEVGMQFYEMAIDPTSILSIGCEYGPDVSDEISDKSPISYPFNFHDDNSPAININSISKLSTGKIQNSNVASEISSNVTSDGKYIEKLTSGDEVKHKLPIVVLEEMTNGKSQKNCEFSGSESQSEISSLCCEICSKKFSQERSLQMHISQTHLGEKPYECVECGKRFIRRDHLNTHFSIHIRKSQKTDDFSQETTLSLDKISSERVPCDICSKEISNKYNLQAHIRRVHYKERRYECTECGRRFAKKSSLKNHSSVHGFSKGIFSLGEISSK